MLEAMVKLARTSIFPVTVNEAEPWPSLVSVLIGHVAQSACSDGVVSLLLSCFSMLALDAQASVEALQAFLPLFSATSDFAIGLVNAANANCGIGVEFLASVIRCPEVYAAARQGRSDGVNVLSCAAQLLSRDVQGKDEAVLSLRRALVKLFSVVVASYPDWDSCTTAVPNGCDFGPRLVNLLFELIQHLKRDTQDLQVALATGETFLLLVECNKKASVGIGKVFHQVIWDRYLRNVWLNFFSSLLDRSWHCLRVRCIPLSRRCSPSQRRCCARGSSTATAASACAARRIEREHLRTLFLSCVSCAAVAFAR